MLLGIPYTLAEIAPLALVRDLFQGSLEQQQLRYVAFDSRQISHGGQTLFVALKTSNRDGHGFIEDAYQKGVRNFLTEEPISLPGVHYALCDNTLESLQAWAMHHRQRFSYPVVGITGSNGKTTVKEWLSSLIELDLQLIKSPMSYNSQLGVPLSLLQMGPMAEVAIIEAGISQVGEMETLATLIQPTLGILTHMGAAHAEGFRSDQEKLGEKLQLFESADQVLLSSAQDWVLRQVIEEGLQIATVGSAAVDELKIHIESQTLQVEWQGKSHVLNLPQTDSASLQNVGLALLAGLKLGVPLTDMLARVHLLQPVEMRMELISDDPDLIILNDTYNSDVDSVRLALRQLTEQQLNPRRMVILSDIPHLGEKQEQIQQEVWEEARQVAETVWLVGPVFHQMGLPNAFPDTDALLPALNYNDMAPGTLLLKGARQFRLERVLNRLRRKPHATFFQIDLNKLSHNFRQLKSQLADGVKTMCMVKAASYGAGTWEIAQQLEKEGATYLTVAYASEGIALRDAGIGMPIMVMNPDADSIDALIGFDLEPEVSNLDFLRRYLRAARLRRNYQYRIHLKLETGMGRLGFREGDMNQLIETLAQYPDLQVVSVMTHLAAADMPSEDEYSRQQVARFQQMYGQLQAELGLQAFRHILNTVGLQRFPEYQFDMVRLGIGLYGINPLGESPLQLEEIGTLQTSISQIQEHEVGESIGYGRSQRTNRKSRIATLPIGYADGIPRSLSNGRFSFLLRGKWASTFGRVCMDMLMLDVTDIPEAQAGDDVILIGQQGEHRISVREIAHAADTIPYEILTRISPRVRRVYVRE